MVINLSNLTANVYSLIFAVFLFGNKVGSSHNTVCAVTSKALLHVWAESTAQGAYAAQEICIIILRYPQVQHFSYPNRQCFECS